MTHLKGLIRATLVVVVMALVLGVGGVAAYKALIAHHVLGAPCKAVAGQTKVNLDTDQAANATTIAAVGKRLGLANHAVTIALAAALQESGLHNLSGGDLDSVGLFQQRPSQGWGSAEQIMSPRYSANAFYQHLAKVPGWEALSVTDAAQAVQHSAAPNAYAEWESQARALAEAFTGEVPAAFACRVSVTPITPTPASLATTMTAELGPSKLGSTVSGPNGWLTSAWLTGHANDYGIMSVTFAGQRWTAKSGTWAPYAPDATVVQINR